MARFAFEPVFAADARAAAARLPDFGLTFDSVRVVIVRPPADTVKDTTIAFAPGQLDVTLDLSVAVHADNEIFHAGIDYTNPVGVVFHGEGTVQAHAADAPAHAAAGERPLRGSGRRGRAHRGVAQDDVDRGAGERDVHDRRVRRQQRPGGERPGRIGRRRIRRSRRSRIQERSRRRASAAR